MQNDYAINEINQVGQRNNQKEIGLRLVSINDFNDTSSLV
jgi:hypothetical protein